MKNKLFMTVLASAFIAAGCSADSDNETSQNVAPAEEEETVEQPADGESSAEDEFLLPFDGTLTHVHGMGYIESDGGLYFASHTGLKVYRDGSWFETDGMYNDYMGFNTVDNGFYTSGHPGTDSDLPNPIGIQTSSDGGRSLESLGFEGETDFHWMGAGYRSHDLFVMNPAPNSEMEAGFYLSENAGEDWERLEPQGLDGDLMALAIHPETSEWLAVASSTGIFLSKDGGATFERLTADGQFGTAVHFTEDHLFYGSHGSEAALESYALDGAESESFQLPDLNGDGAVYIAVNPGNAEEIAFNTAKGNTFFSQDGGATWEMIMDEGQVQ